MIIIIMIIIISFPCFITPLQRRLWVERREQKSLSTTLVLYKAKLILWTFFSLTWSPATILVTLLEYFYLQKNMHTFLQLYNIVVVWAAVIRGVFYLKNRRCVVFSLKTRQKFVFFVQESHQQRKNCRTVVDVDIDFTPWYCDELLTWVGILLCSSGEDR